MKCLVRKNETKNTIFKMCTERIKLWSWYLRTKSAYKERESERERQTCHILQLRRCCTEHFKHTISAILWIDIALSHIHMIIINIFYPVISVFGYAYLKPRFHVAIIVYNSWSINFLLVNTRVITKAQHMPGAIEWVCAFPKCYEPRW